MLLSSGELLGREWEYRYRPEDIRLDIEMLNVLLGLNELVVTGKVSVEILKINALTLCSIYTEVMLRQIGEPIPDDSDTRTEEGNRS